MGSDEESTLFGSAGFMKDRILLTVENDLFGSFHVKAGPGLKAHRLHIILLQMNLNFSSRFNQFNLIDP